MEVVRLGFPLNPLEVVSLDAVNQPDPKGFDSGWISYLLDESSEEESEADDNASFADCVQGKLTTVPGKTTSLWYWFYVPGSGAPSFDTARLDFQYRQGSGDWKTWSNAPVNMGDGWGLHSIDYLPTRWP